MIYSIKLRASGFILPSQEYFFNLVITELNIIYMSVCKLNTKYKPSWMYKMEVCT